MTRPPRSPPLFPYAPLFRSQGEGGRGLGGRSHASLALQRLRPRPELFGVDLAPGVPLCQHALGPDRKSTRLNSSHGYISYAVFCLKKKTKPHASSVSTFRTT